MIKINESSLRMETFWKEGDESIFAEVTVVPVRWPHLNSQFKNWDSESPNILLKSQT